MTQTERRRHRRVSVSLPLTLTMRDQTVETRIDDLSSSGIRFCIPSELPLLSRVQIALELPEPDLGDATSSVALTGVVVRCKAVHEGGAPRFDTAIYFDDISRRARGQLERFLANRSP